MIRGLLSIISSLIIFCCLFLPLSGQYGPGGVGYPDDSEEGQPELVLWLNTALIEEDYENGEAVQDWEDFSGNYCTAESGGETHPVFQTDRLNGYPWIHFDGTQWYSVPEITNLDGGPGVTIFCVVKCDAVDDGGGMKMVAKRNHWNMWGGGLSKETCQYSYNLDFHGRDNDQYVMAHVNGNLPDNKVETESIYGDTSKAYLVTFFYTGSVSAVRVNGETNSGNKPNPNFSVGDVGPVEDYDNDLTIAAAKYEPLLENDPGPIDDFLNGNLAEVIIYRTGLDTTRVKLVENYLASKYRLSSGDFNLYMDTVHAHDLIGVGTHRNTDIDRHVEAESDFMRIQVLDNSIDEPGEFLLAGHDKGEFTAVTDRLPENIKERWGRTWRFEKTGSIDARISFNLDNADVSIINQANIVLLYSPHIDSDFVALTATGAEKYGMLQFEILDEELKTGLYTVGEKAESPSALPETRIETILDVYPVPASSRFELNLQSDYPGSIQLRILDLAGRELRSHQIFKQSRVIRRTINIEDLPSGIYIIQLRQDDILLNRKLIIE